MSNELSEKEANLLFAQASDAIQKNDTVQLSGLMDKEAPVKETVVEPEPAKDVEPAKDDNKNVADKEDVTPPDDKAVDKDAKTDIVDTPVELSELDKLKEQLDRVSKEALALRRQAGQVPHIQKRLHEYDKKIEELGKAKASPSSQADKVDDLLKGIKETDPDLADTIAAAIKAATSGVAEDSNAKEIEQLKFLRNQDYQQYQAQETSRLLDMFPNAREVFQHPAWSEWKQEQSPRIVALADSDTAADVAVAFKMYAADMQAKFPTLANKEVNSESTDTSTAGAAAEKAKKIEAERQRVKETSPNVGSPNAAAKVGMPDDPEALFKKYTAEIQKQMSGG